MIEGLTGLGYGLIFLAILIGVGQVVLNQFGNAVGGTANTTIQTLMGYIGTTSGGLVTWVLPIIAMVVGLYFIGALSGGKGRKV